MGETIRLFYALWPDAETRASLADLQPPLAGRKMHGQDLHITLAFLGQQPAALVPELQGILRKLPPSALHLTLDRIGYFPRSRIVWAGMSRVPAALIALHDDLALMLAGLGPLSPQHGAFTPHVTLARDAPPPEETMVQPVHWHADRIVLVQSASGPQDQRYVVL